mgnify:CR=1 FL=1
MNRYFISDLHLDETRPQTTALFQSFVEKIKENDPQTELYILGDLFESWIGDDYENELHDEVKTTLKSLTGSGIKVSVVVAANGSATPTMTVKGGGYTDNDTITLSRTGTYGGASDITVNVNGVGATATYQWQVSTDGTNFANVSTGSGGTTATYTTAATAAGDNGNKYRCVVGTSQGATPVTSNAATLTVT